MLNRLSLPLLLLVGHLAAALFIVNLQFAPTQVASPWVRHALVIYHRFYLQGLLIHPLVRPVMVGLVLLVVALTLWGRPVRWATELLGALLVLRCLVQFAVLNLLLLTPLRNGGLLLAQLVTFLPVITVAFAWLYWRLDSGARRQGRRHLRFNESQDELAPGFFEYLHASAITLLQFDPSVVSPASRLMKALFVLHGLMMMDLVALTLSRAIGLASGSG